MPLFNRNRAKIEYHRLLQRIAQLQNEINILEGLGQGAQMGGGGIDRSLTTLRANLATQGLSAKRQELAEVKAQAEAMLARDPRVAEPLPSPKTAGPPLDPRRLAIIGAVVLLIVIGAAFAIKTIFFPPPREPVSFLIAPLIEERVSTPGNQFYTSQPINVPYDGGTVTISGHPAPGGKFAIDDRIVLQVTRPDRTTETWERVFNDNCFRNETLDPQEVTALFQRGMNVVQVQLHDVCGGSSGTSGPVFLTIH